MSLKVTILETSRTHNLVQTGEVVVVGVSGGADSLALMHVLHALRSEINCKLHIATLDHGLRGDDGAADVRFVEETARVFDLPVTAGFADVPALAVQHGESTEAAARRARYDFFAQVAAAVGAATVAVAHHRDDQAETVLLHLLRGSGLRGLRGMAYRAPVPGHPSVMLIRPLLDVTRVQIEAYCDGHELEPRQDKTNADPTYTRNFVRLRLMPLLREVNPRVEDALVQFADLAAVDDDFIAAMLQTQVVEPHVEQVDGRVSIDREAFRVLHPALQSRLVRWTAEQLNTDAEVGYVNVQHAVEVGLTGGVGAVAELPGKLRLRVDYTRLVFERADAPLPVGDTLLLEPAAEVTVNVPGETPLDGWTLVASLDEPSNTRARLALPDDATVTLRTRQPGDRFQPLGMGGHSRKLKDWMIDRKIPQHLRDRLPLLVVDSIIAAIVYGDEWTIAEPFAVRDVSVQVVYWYEKSGRQLGDDLCV